MPGAPLALPLTPPPLTQAVDLVHTTQKTLYPQAIPAQHQQLRHRLRTSSSGHVYYADGHRIFALKDGKRKFIAAVEFDIQCLAVALDWLCVGGTDKGRCAFIRLHTPDSENAGRQASSHVNSLLPLDLRAFARSDSPEGLRYVPSNSSRTFPQSARTIHYKNVGEVIVNAITIQVLRPEKKGSRQETVAVVANNDCTVTVYSLDRMKTLDTLYCQYPMNYASLCPNGKILLACGDTPRAFFWRRKQQGHSKTTDFAQYKWEELATPAISNFHHNDDCFTAVFAPDGRTCTIAAQSGNMIKLDVLALHPDMRDDEATLEVLASTRVAVPCSGNKNVTMGWPGAIRSTVFSPTVWGMCAWAEDRGRICVADLRDPNRAAQVVKLGKKDPDTARVEMIEVSPDDDLDDEEPFSQTLRRMGLSRQGNVNMRDQLSDVSTAVDYLEEATHHRRLQQLLRSLDRENTTSSEDHPRLQDLMNEIRILGEEISDRTPDSQRANALPTPRRRTSVVFSQDEQHPIAAGSSLAPILPHNSTLTASPSQLARERPVLNLTPPPPLNYPSPPSLDPWQTISAAMATEPRSRRASIEANLRGLRETRDSLQRAQRASRLRAEQLAREMEWERQTTARSRGTQRPGNNSSAFGSTRTRLDPDESVESMEAQNSSMRARLLQGRIDPQSHLRDSNDRLTELERDLQQLEGHTNALENSVRDTTSRIRPASALHDWSSRAFAASPPVLATDSRGSRPVSTAEHQAQVRNTSTTATTLRNMERARYQRMLQNDRGNATGYLPPDYDAAQYRPTDPHRARIDPDEPLIMGVDWSHDGRFLYIATDVGIYELKVNLKGRRTFPAPTELR